MYTILDFAKLKNILVILLEVAAHISAFTSPVLNKVELAMKLEWYE